MAFNYRAYKEAFKTAARQKGIDPERGATEYQAALVQADLRRDLHYSRLRAGVQAAAERQQATRHAGEGGGLLKNGVVDQARVDQAKSRYWWRAMSPKDWRAGAGSPLVEQQAMAAIRREISEALGLHLMTARDIEQEQIVVLREVLDEKQVGVVEHGSI